MAEELRLEASVVDRFSKPLRDLRDRLRDVRTPDTVKRMGDDFGKVEGAVKNATRSIQGGLSTAMSGLGVTSLAATASIGGVIAAVKGFSAGTIELRQFNRETGLSISMLKAFEHASTQFGVNEDSIAPSLKKMTDNLRDFGRHHGSVYAELLHADPSLMRDLAGKNADQALGIIEKEFARLSDTLEHRQQAGLIAELIFGNRDMVRFGARGREPVDEILKKGAKGGGPSAEDETRAVAFALAIDQLQTSFGKLGKTVGQEVVGPLGTAIGSINSFVEANRGEIGKGVQTAISAIGTAFNEVPWKDVGAAMTTAVKTIKGALDLVPWKQEAKDAQALLGVLKSIIDLKNPGGIARALDFRTDEKKLADAKQALAEHDKAHPRGPVVPGFERSFGALDDYNDKERARLSRDVEKAEEATKKGTAEGVKEGLKLYQQESFSGTGVGGSGGLINASYGGGSGSSGGRGGFGGTGNSGRSGRSGGDPLDDGLRLKGQGVVKGGVFDRASRLMSRLVALGWTEEAAATAAGQAGQESHIRSDGPAGDHGTSHGMFQWRAERFDALRRFAAKRGKPWNDFDTQVDFFDAETKSHGEAAWRKEHDLYRGNLYGKHFERYGDNSFRARLNNAQSALNHYRNGGKQAVPKQEAGSLLRQHREVEGAGKAGQGGKATLGVHVTTDGRVNTKADGGNLFHEMPVSRGRTMVGASIDT